MPPAPPAGQRRTHRTGWIIGASVGAVAAIVAGVVIVGALGDDDPPTPDPTTTTSTEPDEGTPDDDVFATLSDECGAGDMQSCDDLYFAAPVDSLDETFGATCGTRTDGGNPGGCTADVGSSADLWDGCDAGDMQSCDDLYFDAPVDSLAEAFGATCGGRTDGSGAGECVAGLGA